MLAELCVREIKGQKIFNIKGVLSIHPSIHLGFLIKTAMLCGAFYLACEFCDLGFSNMKPSSLSCTFFFTIEEINEKCETSQPPAELITEHMVNYQDTNILIYSINCVWEKKLFLQIFSICGIFFKISPFISTTKIWHFKEDRTIYSFGHLYIIFRKLTQEVKTEPFKIGLFCS